MVPAPVLLDRLHHRAPVLHRVLDVGDLGELELAAGQRLHHFLRDRHVVVVLLADDVDLVVGRLPRPAGRDLFQEVREHLAVIDLRRIDLEEIPVLVAVLLGEGDHVEVGVAAEVGRLVVAERLERRDADQRTKAQPIACGLVSATAGSPPACPPA